MKNLDSDIRIILDALEFKLASLGKEQARLDGSQEDRIAELSNDMYYLEFLIDCLKDDYQKRISTIENNSHEHFDKVAFGLQQPERELV